jgi:hypothetical protein
VSGDSHILCDQTASWEFAKYLGLNLTGMPPGFRGQATHGKMSADFVHSPGIIDVLHELCVNPPAATSPATKVLLKLLSAVTDECSINGLDNMLRATLGVDLTLVTHAEGGLIYIVDATKFLSNNIFTNLIQQFWPTLMVAMYQPQVRSIVGRSIGAAVVHGCNQWLEAAGNGPQTSAAEGPLELETATVQLDYAFGNPDGGEGIPQCGKVFTPTDFTKICEHALDIAQKAAVLPPFVTVACTVGCVAEVAGLIQPEMFVSAKLLFVDVVPLGMAHGLEDSASMLANQLWSERESVAPRSDLTGALFHTSSTLVGKPVALGVEWLNRNVDTPEWIAAIQNVTVNAVLPDSSGLLQPYCKASPEKCMLPPPPPPPPPLPPTPPSEGKDGWSAWQIGAVVAGAGGVLAFGVVAGRRAKAGSSTGNALVSPLIDANPSLYEGDETPNRYEIEV